MSLDKNRRGKNTEEILVWEFFLSFFLPFFLSFLLGVPSGYCTQMSLLSEWDSWREQAQSVLQAADITTCQCWGLSMVSMSLTSCSLKIRWVSFYHLAPALSLFLLVFSWMWRVRVHQTKLSWVYYVPNTSDIWPADRTGLPFYHCARFFKLCRNTLLP